MPHLEQSFIWCWYLESSAGVSKYLESFELWCWKRMEKISWTDRVETTKCYKEERNVLLTIKRLKT